MKLSANSYTSIASTVQTALKKYASAGAQSVITDFHLYPDMVTGELSIFNDDEELLAKTVVKEWVDANPEGFQGGCEMALKKVLNQLSSAGDYASLAVMKPYSFVMVDSEKETLAELLIVDDEETMFLSDELLKGLDEELNAFLKDLLEK